MLKKKLAKKTRIYGIAMQRYALLAFLCGLCLEVVVAATVGAVPTVGFFRETSPKTRTLMR
jgi:hypothetical protein